MEDPRRIIEQIRLTKFGIGSSSNNPLAFDMHQAIQHLAAELYQKDLHFVMELVQNADDNTYAKGVVPSLEFVLVEADLAGVAAGVEWTLLVLNNEVGFSRANVESLCSIGRSTKKGKRDSGYIGEKGIGFKSVFLVTRHPIVISNGYRIRFNDAPTDDTDLGYIVPEWAERPTGAELSECLGISELPNTILVLPIRPDKVQAMREQLLQLSPQLVLFLHKVEKLSARQLSPKGRTASISKGMSVQRRTSSPPRECFSMIPNNCTYSEVRLSLLDKEAVYHIWQQEFPVSPNHEVDHRRDVHTWTITLAFPQEQQKSGGGEGGFAEPDLYAFLPTKLNAGFPFIINADFLLVSSRESIRFESQWNRGILSCVPQVFMTAFIFLLKSASFHSSGAANLRSVYNFVPSRSLSIRELNSVREAIIQQLKVQDIVLCDANLGQHFPASPGIAASAAGGSGSHFFCQPSLARTLNPDFRQLLEKAHKASVQPPHPLISQTLYIVDREVEELFQYSVLSTLGIQSFTNTNRYVECVKSPNWLLSLPEGVYVEVLYFLSQYVGTSISASRSLCDVPMFKYLDDQGNTRLLAPRDKKSIPVYMSWIAKDKPIFSNWTPIFQRWVSVNFMPNRTIQAMLNVSKERFSSLHRWLQEIADIQPLSVQSYGKSLANKCREMPAETTLALGTMHFLFHATQDGYLSVEDCISIFTKLPLVDHSGSGHCDFEGTVLLPGSVCKWPRVLLDGSWERHILCLSESYLELPHFMSSDIDIDWVIQFLRQAVKAMDIFDIKSPPDAPLHISAPWELSRDDVILFLAWLKGLDHIPRTLKKSVKEGEWVKTTDHGDKKPSRCFLDLGQWSNVFKHKDVPFVDTRFYGNLQPYSSILSNLGMAIKLENGVNAVAEHICELAEANCSVVQSDTAIRWYRYLRLHNWMGWCANSFERVIWVPDQRWGASLGSWRSPDDCVISDSEGLFHERLVVLDKYYNDEDVLMFFKHNMRVAASPGTEKYCQLWVDWGENRRVISKENCQRAWCVIARGWESHAKTRGVENFKRRFRIPCGMTVGIAHEDVDSVELARPQEVLYADNLILAEVFSQAFPRPKFAWYPRSAIAASWVEDLVKCYTDLGVKLLSDAVVGGGPTACRKMMSFHSCNITRKGGIGRGLYRAMLGYLADPKHGLSAQARKGMVMQLKDVVMWEVEEVGDVKYTVAVGGEQYEASRTACVRWEKREDRMYVARQEGHQWTSSTKQGNKLNLAQELATELAKGVVGGVRVQLVEGLQELLLLAAGYDFDDHVVKMLLRLRNLRLTLEDEALLGELREAA